MNLPPFNVPHRTRIERLNDVRRDYQAGRMPWTVALTTAQRIYPRLTLTDVGWANLLTGKD